MPESPSLPEFSRRRLLLSGLVAIPAATVLAAATSRPGTGPAASPQAPRPAWPAADSATDAGRAYFC
jgi:hypothetical protein